MAKDWYLKVVPITGTPFCPKMNGEGVAIEYAVQMVQFPSTQTLRDCADKGQLGNAEIDQITQLIASFHNDIAKTDERSPYGDNHDIWRWFVENFNQIKPLLADTQKLQQLEAIETWGRAEWNKQSRLMQQRKRQGYVRECHGDLHLGNMTLIDGKVVIFDCIEFNPMLRWIDVISEVAFLVMDLLHLGFSGHAYRFLNRYLQSTGDYQGVALLRYYLVYRALVRAKVALLRKAQYHDVTLCSQALAEYSVYAKLAKSLTKAKPATLIITHGFSGSGKSTYASQLAEHLGAIQIRSDVERKRLFGFSVEAITDRAINSGIYTQDAGNKTYQHLAEQARAVIAAGYSSIIDAAFLKSGQRKIIQGQLASELNVKFTVLDFQASYETLSKRIAQRQHDPSEATLAVLHQQKETAQPLSSDEISQTISVNTESEKVLEIILAGLGKPD